MNISDITPTPGSKKSPRRVGRGVGSGLGKTCGKGHKGQKARSGGNVHPMFEGGQMPMHRRLPKRGFKNPFRREFAIINIRDLALLADNAEITPEVLINRGLVNSPELPIKLLAVGDIARPVSLKVHAVSEAARNKITAAGGSVEVI
ncbi:MAG: 50S ribosomal protein L15 [Nitrospirae bacterium]|nr:50S ribosomal protein L15 [Nitrospirota bacterium]